MTHTKRAKRTKLLAAISLAAVLLASLPATLFAYTDAVGEEPPQLTQPNPKYPDAHPIELEVDQISTFRQHAMALDTDGEVWTWGYNQDGVIGNGRTSKYFESLTHVELPGKVTQIAAARSISLALLENGVVYEWGSEGSVYNRPIAQKSVPAPVWNINTKIASITAGNNAFALTESGKIITWGNTAGDIGRITGNELARMTPRELVNQSAEKLFAVNGAGFLVRSGATYGWGNNKYILSGSTSTNPTYQPTSTSIGNVKQIAGGGGSMFAVGNNNELYVWGSATTGALGLGDGAYVFSKTLCMEDNVEKVAATWSASFVLKTDGTVWCAGQNINGSLGLGIEDTTHIVWEHTKIEGLEDVVDIVASSAADAVFVKKADGSWWGWGDNYGLAHVFPEITEDRYFDSPVLIFTPDGTTTPVEPPEPEPDDEHTITITETWADGSEDDIVTTRTVEDGKAFSFTFATPAGYTAGVDSEISIAVNYEAGRLYSPSVTQSFAITITYTGDGEEEPPPEPDDEHTITITQTWADGAEADIVTTHTVEDGKAFSYTFNLPAGYTATVDSEVYMAVNYEANRIYSPGVGSSYAVTITYTPE